MWVQKTKEDNIMKKQHNKAKANLRIYRRPYPNAADSNYLKNKIVDGVLSLVSTMGVITFFCFLATI